MRHRVLLFDVDNTLINSGGAGRRALERAVLEVTGIEADLLRVPFAGRTDPAILRDLFAVCGVAAAPDRLAWVFERYIVHLDREVGTDGAGGRVLPGVAETIAALEGRPGVHLGILTGNIAAGARLKLRPFGLARHFRFGAYGEDAGSRPALLPVALERWRRLEPDAGPCAMDDVYVIGDTVHDVAVAKEHGARSVAVGTGGRFQPREALLEARPTYFFEDLRAAGPFIEEVLGGP